MYCTAHIPCSMSCGSLEGRGVWGRMDTCIGMAKSLCCPPETITILLISYTPIQNKKFNLKKRQRALVAINVCLVLFYITDPQNAVPNQWHQQYLRAWQKCTFSGPSPDLWKQKLWELSFTCIAQGLMWPKGWKEFVFNFNKYKVLIFFLSLGAIFFPRWIRCFIRSPWTK